jgi:two-component system chemotaxis response regulator CheY
MRRLLREILEGSGYRICAEAVDGRAGVLSYLSERPDVVLLDIAMPVMDGITSLERIRALDEHANIIMCSALGEDEMILRAIQLGAGDFVVKPFRPERVLSAVEKSLIRHGRVE